MTQLRAASAIRKLVVDANILDYMKESSWSESKSSFATVMLSSPSSESTRGTLPGTRSCWHYDKKTKTWCYPYDHDRVLLLIRQPRRALESLKPYKCITVSSGSK